MRMRNVKELAGVLVKSMQAGNTDTPAPPRRTEVFEVGHSISERIWTLITGTGVPVGPGVLAC